MWRKITEDDLVATLSRKEIDSYRRDFEIDPVPVLLADTASWARGYIRSNGNVKMDPDELSLPASCISPAMDYAVVKILKRINLEPVEIRKQARIDAIEYFNSIAEGRINPESFETDPTEPTGGSCAVVIKNARPHVTSNKLEGL